MRGHINCIAHNSSEGRLLLGDDYAAVVDCGMAFCADETIKRIKAALNGRPLDYILLTHTHYDHVGALASFRAEWPGIMLMTSEAGAAVLQKDTPRRVIRELSAAASAYFGSGAHITYADEALYADAVIKDGDSVRLGGLTVETMEAPGHTRDSLCFFIPELELLMLNETPGVLMPDGSMYPCFLTGYDDTMNTIDKCKKKKYAAISLPHRGIAGDRDMAGFFGKAVAANETCHKLIVEMLDKNIGEDEMTDILCKKYLSDVLLTYQPREAFEANTKAIIACVKKERR
jgi:glyoxylase-like metal-dependent hydrolase (beta-lactamase superfamily II)